MSVEIEQVYTWDDSQVEDIIGRALAVVDAVSPPDDLRVTAFEKAISMLSHHHGIPKQSAVALPIGRLDG